MTKIGLDLRSVTVNVIPLIKKMDELTGEKVFVVHSDDIRRFKSS